MGRKGLLEGLANIAGSDDCLPGAVLAEILDFLVVSIVVELMLTIWAHFAYSRRVALYSPLAASSPLQDP